MRKHITLTLAVILLFGLGILDTAYAQASKDEVQLVQSLWGMQKRDIVVKFMNFSDSESAKFFPLYDAYTEEYKKLGAERINLISDYSNNYSAMTDAKADELSQKFFKNNMDIDKLQQKYYGKIKKELSALRAAQFMQLEYYLQTMIRSELQSDIPIIGELEKSARQ